MTQDAAQIIADLEECNATQAETIKALWVEMAFIKKRDDNAQAYIPKLKARIAALEAQTTPQAIAERLFQ